MGGGIRLLLGGLIVLVLISLASAEDKQGGQKNGQLWQLPQELQIICYGAGMGWVRCSNFEVTCYLAKFPEEFVQICWRNGNPVKKGSVKKQYRLEAKS